MPSPTDGTSGDAAALLVCAPSKLKRIIMILFTFICCFCTASNACDEVIGPACKRLVGVHVSMICDTVDCQQA